MIKVMFLCTGNSCRSQMAEGFARTLGKGVVEPFSAGLMAAGVHPRAIAVMQEVGIDLSGQESKEIDPELLAKMDLVITLCGHADAACPTTPPGVKRLHRPIQDPVGTVGSEAVVMAAFRRARNEIKATVEDVISDLRSSERIEGREE